MRRIDIQLPDPKRYKDLRKIGGGLGGSVYSALDSVTKTRVAIKCIKVHDESLVERAQRELHLLRRLAQHPHVVKLLDSKFFCGTLLLIMEYLPWTVAELIRSRPTGVTPGFAVKIAREAASALSRLHAVRMDRVTVVHRDVKPSNLLLSAEGVVKLADFGIATKTDNAGDTTLTLRSDVVGTPPYWSPEQTTNPLLVDARSDIYSLGIVLFEMLTGIRPFTGCTSDEQIAATRESSLPDASASLRGLSVNSVDVLLQILDRMTAKEPRQRYKSCTTLIQALDRLLLLLARDGAWSKRTSDVTAAPPALLLINTRGPAAGCTSVSEADSSSRSSSLWVLRGRSAYYHASVENNPHAGDRRKPLSTYSDGLQVRVHLSERGRQRPYAPKTILARLRRLPADFVAFDAVSGNLRIAERISLLSVVTGTTVVFPTLNGLASVRVGAANEGPKERRPYYRFTFDKGGAAGIAGATGKLILEVGLSLPCPGELSAADFVGLRSWLSQLISDSEGATESSPIRTLAERASFRRTGRRDVKGAVPIVASWFEAKEGTSIYTVIEDDGLRLVGVPIKRGASDGELIKVQLPARRFWGRSRDIVFVLHVLQGDILHRDLSNGDLFVVAPLTLTEALEGASPVICGPTSRVRLQVPKGVASHQVIRIPEQGGWQPDGVTRGDLLAVTRIELPTAISETQRNSLVHALSCRLR